MAENNDNPYAAPQAELSSSSSSVPLAQEVFQRNLFPEVSTKDLERITNASLSISALDTIYVLPNLLSYVVILLMLFVVYYNDKFHWDLFKLCSLWAIAFVPSTTYALFVSQRYSWSRYLGMLLDSIVTVLIIGCAVVSIIKLSLYGGLLLLLFAFFPARAFQARYRYPMLYGPDRVEHKDLLMELAFRRTHQID